MPQTPPLPVLASPATTDAEALMQALSAPFEVREVKFKPAVVNGTRALALAYVDARVIQDRLDDVLGVTGWQDEYECLPDGAVVCRLRLRIGGEWITKMDVGGPSEQPDEGDRRKAAFSDALKRAAVKFGIGRYLYRLPAQWVDYDPQRKQFTRTPMLPPSALPRSQPPVRLAPPAPPAGHLPANGAELQKRLSDFDTRLAQQGLIQPGELIQHIVAAGRKAGHAADLTAWAGPAIRLAVEETKVFASRVRQQSRVAKEVA